ncbi:hypothetical protein D3C71_2251440 [compost metagenome]
MQIATNRFYLSTNKFDCTSLDSLGSFCGVTHDKHRLTERRSLFLNTTRVGKDQVGTIHQVNER